MEQNAWIGFLKWTVDKCAFVSTKEPFVVEVTPKYQQPQSVDVPGVETTSAFTGDKLNPPGGGGPLSAFWRGLLGRIRCLHSALKMFFTLCSEKLRRYCRALLAPVLELFETAQS